MAEAVRFKRSGVGLEMKVFAGSGKRRFLVLRTPRGAFHVFAEVDAKDAAVVCGSRLDRKTATTRQMWQELWSRR